MRKPNKSLFEVDPEDVDELRASWRKFAEERRLAQQDWELEQLYYDYEIAFYGGKHG